jgi:hypothetical protein
MYLFELVKRGSHIKGCLSRFAFSQLDVWATFGLAGSLDQLRREEWIREISE